MGKWSKRGRWIGVAIGAGVMVLVYVAWPYGRMASNMYFYGPSALARTAVSAPTETVRYGNEPKQSADLRVPPGKGPFPIAVLMHGGCWDSSFGVSSDMAPLADALTKLGVATLNIRYCVVGDAGGGWFGT
ncbi:MAG: hypothetical protein ING75_02985 [Rhodocyclaceae bacterium]|nr:hypothetical protein [Rhodocyclaceae bacterium]